MLNVNSKTGQKERKVRLLKASNVNGELADINTEHTVSQSIAIDLVAAQRAVYLDAGETADEAGRVPGQVDLTVASIPPGAAGPSNAQDRIFVSPANAAPQGDVGKAIDEVKKAQAPLARIASQAPTTPPPKQPVPPTPPTAPLTPPAPKPSERF